MATRAKGERGGQGRLYGRTPAQNKTVRDIARRTANLKKEQMRIVDRGGNILLEKRGPKGEVASTVGEQRQFAPNALVIHNHPEGGTFSAPDLREFGYGATEIVAAAPEGTYRLIKVSSGTPDWVSLRDMVEAIPEVSPIDLRRQAREKTANSRTQKALDAINREFERIRNKDGLDAARAYAMQTKARYDELSAKRKAEIDAESRRIETQPFDDIYRKYARQFGMRYVFEPSRKKR